jgi:uncharacterized protein (TIGR02118 family)
MAATLVVMYKTPKDKAAFDKHYVEKHIPLAKKIPGVRKYEVSQGPVATPAGPSPDSQTLWRWSSSSLFCPTFDLLCSFWDVKL